MTSPTLRGGSWNNNPRNLRVSNRNRNEPAKRNNNNGFRCIGDGGPCPHEEGQNRFAHSAKSGVSPRDPEVAPGLNSQAKHKTGLASW